MITVVNKYKHSSTDNDFYIGRGSVFGNPYSHKEGTLAKFVVTTRDIAIESYRDYIIDKLYTDKSILESFLQILKLHRSGEQVYLVCYCKPKSCHGDILKDLLEDEKFITDLVVHHKRIGTLK